METIDHHGASAAVTADLRRLPDGNWTGDYAIWDQTGEADAGTTYHLAPGPHSELVEQVYDAASRAGAL